MSDNGFVMPSFSKGEFGLLRDLVKIHRADIQDVLADPDLSRKEREEFLKGKAAANELYRKLNSILDAIDRGQL